MVQHNLLNVKFEIVLNNKTIVSGNINRIDTKSLASVYSECTTRELFDKKKTLFELT